MNLWASERAQCFSVYNMIVHVSIYVVFIHWSAVILWCLVNHFMFPVLDDRWIFTAELMFVLFINVPNGKMMKMKMRQ